MRPVILALALSLAAANASAQLRTQTVVSGLSQLVAYVADPSTPGVFYAVQQSGLVRVVQNGVVLPEPFLDLRGAISAGGERGLLGLAFSPDAGSGRVFVNFTNVEGHTVIARFNRSTVNPLVADPTSRFDLVWPNPRGGGLLPYIEQPAANHNGGHLAFGPDGYLYIGLGDGGGANDTYQTAQDPNTLLGKMLRIDVGVANNHPTGYQVPRDNPFVDGVPIAALPEIWDFGLRNPWRYSFDDPSLGGTGALFIGDVGQGAREEVSYEPAASGGRNFEWPMREGLLETGIARPVVLPSLTPPLFDYPRSVGTTVTGGYVYRGRALGPPYVGRYFVADFGSGRVWSVGWQPAPGGTAVVTDVIEHTSEFGGPVGPVSSFGIDRSGELYLVIISGRVLKIVPANATEPTAPSNLSAVVSGRSVTLDWTGSAGATHYRLEVGRQPGGSDLLVYDTDFLSTSLTAVAVPDGVYHVRVRALNAAGVSPPSNEIVVTVGCVGVPAAPTSFIQTLSGRNVTLIWAASGDLTSILLEVGTGPSLSNAATFVLPPSARSISGTVAPGTYYARLRAVNTCGASVPSTELMVTVP